MSDDLAKKVAEVIWATSRRDEGTISAMGADIIAAALLPLIREREATAWDEGWDARHENYWSGDENPYADGKER